MLQKNFIRARLQTLLKLFRPVVTRAPSIKMTNDNFLQNFGFQLERFLSIVHLNVGQFLKFCNIGVQATSFPSSDYKIFY